MGRVNLVSWCFEPSQPQRIISRLRETFIKRYIDERTDEAEKDRKNSEKAESCWENLWKEIQLKGPMKQKKTGRTVRKRRVVGRIYGRKYS